MFSEEKRCFAVSMLKNAAESSGRLPKRSDFTGEEVCFIKQMLGPWPRALEAAGLKQPPAVSARDKSRMKRERRKKLLKAQRKAERNNNALPEIENGGDRDVKE